MDYDAFIALGANVEPRVRTMLSALHRLSRSDGIRVEEVSPVYLSEAHTVDDSPQPDYLNAVARVGTRLEAPALLARCLEVEESLGRDPEQRGKWKPRRIDLDLLLHSGGPVASAGLQVPHPGIPGRLFVLLPLSDLVLRSTYVDDLGATLGDLITACPDRGRIRKVTVSLGNYK